MTSDHGRDLEPVSDGGGVTLQDVARPDESRPVGPDHLASLARGLEQSRAGQLSSVAEVDTVLALFDV